MVNKGTVIGIVVVVLVLVGGGVWFATQKSSTDSMTADVPEVVEPTGVMMEEENATNSGDVMEESGTLVELEVTNTGFKFNPATLTVKEGDTVRITFTSSAATGIMHDFVIDEFDVATSTLADGESETIEFVASKAGTYEYYCSVGNHREMGMMGSLVVE